MRTFLTLAACLTAFPAVAQDRPTVLPTRDVSVAYRANSPGGTAEMRISWLVARGMMRVDMPGGMLGWLLVDLNGKTGVMVMEAQRMVMDLPAGQIPPGAAGGSPNARYPREAGARVANLDCTNWRVEDQGETARVCLTAEGVMLRAENLSGPPQSRGVLEATAVTFGAQDPARFQRPTGDQSFQMPGGLPPGMAPGMAPGMPRGTALPPPGMAGPGR